jgi:UDP:flavonoid glycosyltransferase YjiC (YdhE family)
MTHGGLNSVNEATYHGVPLIVFPLFADQDYNAYRINIQELGVSIEPRDFSQELMDGAVEAILRNPK